MIQHIEFILKKFRERKELLVKPIHGLNVRRVVLKFIKIFLAITGILSILAILVTWSNRMPLQESLTLFWFVGGVLILAYAGIMGSGFIEHHYYRSSLMALSHTYMTTITKEYPQRRREQLDTMIVASLFGVTLIGLAVLMTYFWYLVLPVILILIFLGYYFSRISKKNMIEY